MKVKANVGQHVKWFDPVGQPHDALVTAVHSTQDFPSINVVVVNCEPGQTDNYGQKIQRETSVVHKTNQSAHGRYWLHDDEMPADV
jgi:hypothetical protein